MPYFIYRIHPPRKLEYVDTKDKFQDARTIVRSLRAEDASADPGSVRMIFAKNAAEAEKILSAPPKEGVFGED